MEPGIGFKVLGFAGLPLTASHSAAVRRFSNGLFFNHLPGLEFHSTAIQQIAGIQRAGAFGFGRAECTKVEQGVTLHERFEFFDRRRPPLLLEEAEDCAMV